MQHNSPYQAPQAQLEQDIAHPGSAVVIRRASASQGAKWFFAGFRRVFQSPLPWTAIGAINLLLLIVFVLLAMIPVLGSLISSLFYPVLAAGFIQAAANQDKGQLKVADLFAGFSQQTGQLFLTGALYIAMLLGAMTVVGIITLTLGISLPMSGARVMDQELLLLALLALLLFAALTLPAIMAIWFAPALIILAKTEAIEAIKLSFKACLRNVMAYLIYGLVAALVMTLIAALIAVIIAATTIGNGSPSVTTFVVMGLLYLLMGLWGAPVLFCSIYQSYVDIFQQEKPAAPAANESLNNSNEVITRQ
jgi:hypothetical protein